MLSAMVWYACCSNLLLSRSANRSRSSAAVCTQCSCSCNHDGCGLPKYQRCFLHGMLIELALRLCCLWHAWLISQLACCCSQKPPGRFNLSGIVLAGQSLGGLLLVLVVPHMYPSGLSA